MPADTFPAMGSEASVYVVEGPASLVERARARIEALEGLWSRFRPASELTRLNDSAGGHPRRVSPETFELIRRGIEAWRMTGGLYDPTVLGDVLRAGYTTSFDELRGGPRPAGESGLTRGAGDIELDLRTRSVRLPAGVGFDPGGIGKGLAADLVVADLLAAGAAGACVNLGGDVRAAGTPPEESWAIAIEHPTRPTPIAVAQLRDGAVATSSRLRRCWSTSQGVAHHLIDPRRGAPSDTTVGAATVIAARGWHAEAFAKAAFLAGPSGLATFDRLGVAVVLVDVDGEIRTNRCFHQFVDPPVDAPVLTEVSG
jgi:FAD:protein FMN transferase